MVAAVPVVAAVVAAPIERLRMAAIGAAATATVAAAEAAAPVRFLRAGWEAGTY